MQTIPSAHLNDLSESVKRRRGLHGCGCSLLPMTVLLFATTSSSPVSAQTVTATIPAGNDPYSIAVNTVTNKIYVANYYGGGLTVNNSGTVTVIDGATNVGVAVPAGNNPNAVAVNPMTNTIYVSNFNSGFLTEINGSTNGSTEIPVGLSSHAIAVNTVTNKVYVESGTILEIIDGVTSPNAAFAFESGVGPVAVNPVTNKIYVGNGNTVVVIDGATNASVGVPVGVDPYAIAVNTVTNKIYVANNNQGGSGTVTVIDGATNAATSVPVGSQPAAIAVNTVTNKIYVANAGAGGTSSGSGVTVIDGATNATTFVAAGSEPIAIAVNSLTDQIYVANFASSTVTVINGATNSTTTVPVGPGPDAIAVNPVTNMIYTANAGGNTGTVTVINGAAAAASSAVRISNVSARAQVGSGGNVLIPGFVIGGSGAETLLIRAAGPGLAQFGLSGVLAEPSLSVFDSAGHLVASNTGWGTNVNPGQIADVIAQVGAFAFAPGSSDCALEVSLSAGAYTAQISGVNNATGLALAEIYEVSSSGTRLINISTRAQVGTNGNIIVLGVVITGPANGSEVMLMRGDGPALTQFGVTGVLAQPSLSVFDNAGNVVAANTGWGHSFEEDLIAGFAAAVGTFPLPPGSPDSAQFVSLSPGTYTMQLSGANATTGVALAEAFEEQ